MPRLRLRRRRAFTLVELLVVIGIIALLISILMPVLSKAKQQANAVACSSQMRQVFLAMIQYAGDNRDHLPIAPWIGVRPTQQYAQCAFTFDTDGVANYQNKYGCLLKYLGKTPLTRNKLMQCPDDLQINPFDGSLLRNFSFSFNYQIDIDGLNPVGRTVKLTQVHNPAQKILIFEERLPNDGYCVWDLWDADALTTRHPGGRANLGFADGHVTRFVPKEVFANIRYCDLTLP